MIKSIRKPVKSNGGYKSMPSPKKIDCGFYGEKDLKPTLTKKIDSTGGYK